MRNFLIVKWLRNVPITRKLYFTVGLMAMLIAIELFTLQFAIRTLSSVRTLVGAEGLWSKAQKDAAYSLQKYGRTRNEKDYQQYLYYLAVPLGDRKTRLELLKPHPDIQIARQGFLEGRVHPDDIDGAIKLFRRFHNISYINKAAKIWTKGDSLIDGQISIGTRLHNQVQSGDSSQAKINTILADMDPLNDELTKLEDNFSFILGEGSRWLAGLVLGLLLGLVLTVEVCGLTITILVSRGISKGLGAILASSGKIAAGDYSVRAKIYSQDEIGKLAASFNDMTGKLEQNINDLKRSKQQLKDAKAKAEESVVIKTNFLANMSHEIRTPMNAVIGFTGLLESTDMDERQQEFVKAIKISGQNLMTIINDILDYSKIESGKIIIEKNNFSIRDTFRSLQVLLHTKVLEKKLDIRFQADDAIPEMVIGDPARLMQILLNLCDNAIKFTEQGTVEILARGRQHSGDKVDVTFTIKDTGKGISADKLSLIFERFTQASTEATRRHGGTGLGLSIAKNLVEMQGGHITVESKPGKGSSFYFTITYQVGKPPVETIQEPVKEQLAAPPLSPGTLRILLAEDNKINQSLAVHVLKKFGFVTDIAENGKIAVEKMQQGQYDLILMDMQMPEMDGYEATVFIRNELKSNIPIIALTAHVLGEEKEKCLSLGMNDYISKPFNPQELYSKIVACTRAA